jgi:hypothetical protein
VSRARFSIGIRTLLLGLAFTLACAPPSWSDDVPDSPSTSAGNPTVSLFIARAGQRIDVPHVGTFHYLQFLQMRGKWIVPDIGYIDFATANYRELFLGGGRTLVERKKLMLAEELYFVQATGPAAGSARYLWPWTLLQLHFTPKFGSETVYFPYLPLNRPARVQHVLDRSKFEYALTKSVKIGAGYAGYKYGDLPWQSRPFLTTTVSTRAGAFEFWLQRMPDGAQAQIRYTFVHLSGTPLISSSK